jgi:hypothetical protein
MEVKMPVLSKKQLMKEIKLFLKDKDRGISIELFGELAGLSKLHIEEVFTRETRPLTEYTQKRVNRAYEMWKSGRVRVMRKHSGHRYVDFKKEPEIPLYPNLKIEMVNGMPKVTLGPVNRHDYSNISEILSKRG